MITEKQHIIDLIVTILKRYPIKKASIFGSFACDTFTDDSDVDILISSSEVLGLRFNDLVLELEEKLGRPVDLFTYEQIFSSIDEDIHWNFKSSVRNQEVIIYDTFD